jgi:hypothetical protein
MFIAVITANCSSLTSLQASSVALRVSSSSFCSASTVATRSVVEVPHESNLGEGACCSNPTTDEEGGSRWAWRRGGSPILVEEPTSMNILLGKLKGLDG